MNLIIKNKRPVRIGNSLLFVIPKVWVDAMDLTQEDTLIVSFVGDKMVVVKDGKVRT